MLYTNRPPGIDQSIGASIEVASLQLSYTPGDTIHGIVKKVNIGICVETVAVIINLIVRVETEVTIRKSASDGNLDDTTYRGEKTPFSFRQQIYHGPASPGINTWPFSITIPERERPLEGVAAIPEPLPPTFYRPSESIFGGHRNYIFVEYRLEAETHPLTAPRAVATFPVYVRPRSTIGSIADPGPRLSSINQSVKTLRLYPEYTHTDLTVRQHMQSIFQRSTLPRYSYSIIVQHPSIIQLEHPDALSFELRALSIADPTQTTSFLVEKPPVLTLISAVICLRSATHVDALDGGSRYVTSKEEGGWQKTHLVEWRKGMSEVQIPIQQDGTVDIGKNLQLRLSSRGVSISQPHLIRDASFKNPMIPSFETRHVSHVHELKWKLVVACAGKERKILGTAPVTVLGPSEHVEQQKELRVGAEGAAHAHRDWASGVVDIPMLAGSVTDRTHGDGVNSLVDILPPVTTGKDALPAYTGPKV